MEEIAALLGATRQLVRIDPRAAEACLDKMVALLSGRESLPKPEENDGAGLGPWQQQAIEAHIQVHIGGPIKVGALAKSAHVSISRLNRVFKTSFGKSPSSYIMEKRIKRAQYLMAMTDEPLSQIALSCGFSHQAHLTSAFRKWVGISPSALRRSLREREVNPADLAL
ncbi:helix-turn-helix transcriptional regulator [Neorhizobium galegae]|uniref:helix-turn-helix transcriptional regulator n=1 Tax=Neorhizobium galegae TaxID=399 RepID=UPI001F3BBB40|nr:AraC family transcriptional regulator [Neorhizobium galegae]UIK04781.1 AraC family transcriptional regulator [Neorhizobium galegae]